MRPCLPLPRDDCAAERQRRTEVRGPTKEDQRWPEGLPNWWQRWRSACLAASDEVQRQQKRRSCDTP